MIQPLKIVLTLIILTAFTPINVTAGPLDDGQDAYEAGDMTGAFSHFMSAAQSGDDEGQYYIGLMYLEGTGTAQSNAKAVEWFQKSAAQENADAMTYLGGLHEEGKGLPFSIEKAKYWFTKGAAKGDPYAKDALKRLATTDPDKQLEMANLYAEGEKAPLNKPLAAYWYEKSAAQGNDTAMTYLGQMLEDGDGISMHRTAALTWYEKAAKQGNWIAGDMADELKKSLELEAGNTKPDGFYDDGKSAKQPPSHKLPEGFSLYTQPTPQLSIDVIRPLIAKAESGDVDAQEKLGLMYYHGDGVPQSYEKARPWLDKAAIERRMDAMMAYANMFDKGLGVQQEDWAAKFWYGEAAKKGNVEAKAWVKAYDIKNPSTSITARAAPNPDPVPEIKLGTPYKSRTLTQSEKDDETLLGDLGVKLYNERKYASARELWLPYAEGGECRYQSLIGDSYYQQKNYIEAQKWYERAVTGQGVFCESYVAESAYTIGLFHHAGQSITKNKNLAAGWYKIASDQKNFYNEKAAYSLGSMYLLGTDIPYSEYDAYVYFSKAAEKDHIKAKVELAHIFEEGHPYGWKMKPEKIIGHYTDAANAGYDYGQFRLALAHYNGKNTPQSYAKALTWFQKAAQQGHMESQFNLGYMYYLGEGTAKNTDQAVYWYKKSAEQGYSSAVEQLKKLGL